jgi:hypothetical protein
MMRYTHLQLNPRLIALTGPRQGSSFEFLEDEMLIGCDATNWICLSDVSASRKTLHYI